MTIVSRLRTAAKWLSEIRGPAILTPGFKSMLDEAADTVEYNQKSRDVLSGLVLAARREWNSARTELGNERARGRLAADELRIRGNRINHLMAERDAARASLAIAQRNVSDLESSLKLHAASYAPKSPPSDKPPGARIRTWMHRRPDGTYEHVDIYEQVSRLTKRVAALERPGGGYLRRLYSK